MIQTGDPTGTGKGGQSIWVEYFPVIFEILNFYLFID
jgi:cyclophilin family peptidyl-prolyl cis-trans isomerase